MEDGTINIKNDLQTCLLQVHASGTFEGYFEELEYPEITFAPETSKSSAVTSEISKELCCQARLAAPLAIQLFALSFIPMVTLSYSAELGTQATAAVSMGNCVARVLGLFVLLGLSGAINTQASQAYGSGEESCLPIIFQRSVVFLLAHTMPLTGLICASPYCLKQMGQPEELCRDIKTYITCLLPMLWIECINRPLSAVLLARGITLPQMWIAVATAACHVGGNQLFVRHLQLGLCGAGYAVALSSLTTLICNVAVVCALGMQEAVWGTPSWQAFTKWRHFGRLAYPACAMRCMESWAWSAGLMMSSFLVDGETAVAALGVAINLYAFFYMGYVAVAQATCVRVGIALGAGDTSDAKLSAWCGLLCVPILWLVGAVMMLAPPCQTWLLSFFAPQSNSALMYHLRCLLVLVVASTACDGVQTALTGVLQGCGKQMHGAGVNLMAFYLFALPLAAGLAFGCGMYVEGVLAGLVAGPAVAAVVYVVLVSRIDWHREAALTAMRIQVLV